MSEVERVDIPSGLKGLLPIDPNNESSKEATYDIFPNGSESYVQKPMRVIYFLMSQHVRKSFSAFGQTWTHLGPQL